MIFSSACVWHLHADHYHCADKPADRDDVRYISEDTGELNYVK